MPELPEVEVVRSGLERLASPFHIERAEVLHPRTSRFNGSPSAIESELFGATIEGWAVRGKYLWAILSTGKALIIHLGMSGQVLYDAELVEGRPHTRAIFHGKEGVLSFVDQRTFGYLRIDSFLGDNSGVPAGRGQADGRLPSSLTHIARDVLDPYFDAKKAAAAAKKSNRNIKSILLDQTIASGIGNIYADETLFESGVHPEKKASLIAVSKLVDIFGTAGKVMLRALAQGGTSFDSLYVNTDGDPGYFAQSLKAYGRAGLPCVNCGKVLNKIVVGGRGTTFCGHCQRK